MNPLMPACACHIHTWAPELLAGMHVEAHDSAELPRSDDDVSRRTAGVYGGEDGRRLKVCVGKIAPFDLLEPLQLAGAIKCEFRVGVQIRTWPTAPVRELRGAWERRRIAGAADVVDSPSRTQSLSPTGPPTVAQTVSAGPNTDNTARLNGNWMAPGTAIRLPAKRCLQWG